MNERDLAVRGHTRKRAKPRKQAEHTKLKTAATFAASAASTHESDGETYAQALACVLRRHCTDQQSLDIAHKLAAIFRADLMAEATL